MTVIKICGITNLADATAAAEGGADALGFNFYPRSPRFVSADVSGEIGASLPGGVIKVGVFVDATVDEIISTAEAAGLDGVQLHGTETAEFVSRLRGLWRGQLIKAFRVGAGFQPDVVKRFDVDAVLLDAFSPAEYGGTGEIFDWAVAEKVREMVGRMYLAGGLGADNVGEAIRRVRPYGVDACSRLESAKGLKDRSKLSEFIRNARQAL